MVDRAINKFCSVLESITFKLILLLVDTGSHGEMF